MAETESGGEAEFGPDEDADVEEVFFGSDEDGDDAGFPPEGGAPRRRRLPTARLSLALIAAGGLALGGWLGLRPAPKLSAAQKDQVIVRLDPAADEEWAAMCADSVDKIKIPLKNYGPGPVAVRSVTVDGSWSGGGPQPLSATIAPGRTATVVFVLTTDPSICAHSPVPECDPYAEAVVDATFTFVPLSGRSRDVRLPIGAWEGAQSWVYPYPPTNPHDSKAGSTC